MYLSDQQARELARHIAEYTNMSVSSSACEMNAWVKDALADEYGITSPRKSLVAYVAKLARIEWLLLVQQTKQAIEQE